MDCYIRGSTLVHNKLHWARSLSTNMAAFFRVWRFTHRMMLLDVLSTVNLAGSKGCYTSVRLSINILQLAVFGCLYYLAATGLSHFHITLNTSLRFKNGWNRTNGILLNRQTLYH